MTPSLSCDDVNANASTPTGLTWYQNVDAATCDVASTCTALTEPSSSVSSANTSVDERDKRTTATTAFVKGKRPDAQRECTVWRADTAAAHDAAAERADDVRGRRNGRRRLEQAVDKQTGDVHEQLDRRHAADESTSVHDERRPVRAHAINAASARRVAQRAPALRDDGAGAMVRQIAVVERDVRVEQHDGAHAADAGDAREPRNAVPRLDARHIGVCARRRRSAPRAPRRLPRNAPQMIESTTATRERRAAAKSASAVSSGRALAGGARCSTDSSHALR